MKGLPKLVSEYLTKARESAILAVEVYNKPSVTFRSGGYITLMIIAWTALFHAICLRKGVKPYRKNKNRYIKIDNEYLHWNLNECLIYYFGSDTGNPIKANLVFFTKLRNRIEHRSYSTLDNSIFGECQALLLNFEEILLKEFPAKYSIKKHLSLSLQMFESNKAHTEALIKSKSELEIHKFVSEFRSSISRDVYETGKYAFKVFLIQTANHASRDSLPVMFCKYDDLSTEDKQNVNDIVAVVSNPKQQKVFIAITQIDVVKNFLIDADISCSEAVGFLKRICQENTLYLPFQFYAHKTRLDNRQLIKLIRDSCLNKHHCDSLIKIHARPLPSRFVVGNTETETQAATELKDLLERFSRRNYNYEPYSLTRFLQAITHASHDGITPELYHSLLTIFESFQSLTSSQKTTFRKAICYLDAIKALH